MKKKLILLFILIFIFIFMLVFPFVFINIKLIGDYNIKLDYGEEYSESGYKANFLNENITSDIKVNNNIKDKIGNYQVVYSYRFWFYNIKAIRKVIRDDFSGPTITLKGDKEVSIVVNSEYVESGFEAVDLVDGDLTNSVIVTNNVVSSEIGEYEVKYEVSDSSGNVSVATRKVKVEKLRPYQMSLKDYSLDGWYDSVKLKETEDYGNDYFNKFVMIGDSNTMNMYLNGYLNGLNAWAIPCLHAESMHNIEINLYGLGIKMKLLDAIEKYKPEKIILNFGTFSSAWISEDVFIEKANLLIELIKEKSPDTDIVLISIYPIRSGDNINDFKQETINKINFLILEMADKYKLKYLDVQEVLKNDDGYGNSEYISSDKFHLTNLGHNVVRKYIRTHALEED